MTNYVCFYFYVTNRQSKDVSKWPIVVLACLRSLVWYSGQSFVSKTRPGSCCQVSSTLIFELIQSKELRQLTKKVAMSPTDSFCLQWNGFSTHLSEAFTTIREEKDLFDVTLCCEDNQIEAHKLILSASSTFFRSIFRSNPHKHPLLYLRGVKFKELSGLLNFMYHGQVSVAETDLNSFLTVAADLKIRGLTQPNTETSLEKYCGSKQIKTENGHSFNDLYANSVAETDTTQSVNPLGEEEPESKPSVHYHPIKRADGE